MEITLLNDRLPSLWNMILSNIAPNEIYEVKSFLGEDLVDQSIELRNEIETLLEIYEIFSKERAAGDNAVNCLPEPPELRHRLLLEIQFFVQGIRDQARSQGRNPDRVLEKHRSDIIDYAYESSSSRPTTSEASYLSTSRSSYRATPISDRINVNLMKDKLNYMAFEEVQANLKLFLQDEVDQLNLDLIELQNSLYNDDLSQCQSRLTITNQPTISELKKERHDLEQILLQSSQPSTQRNINKSSINNNKGEKRALFKFLPDAGVNVIPVRSRTIKSPPRLKPLDHKMESHLSTYEESPLDLGLPETSSSFQDLINSNNNSSMSSTSKSPSNNAINVSLIPNPPSGKSMNFNSAQKFRQKVLQNRKQSLDH